MSLSRAKRVDLFRSQIVVDEAFAGRLRLQRPANSEFKSSGDRIGKTQSQLQYGDNRITEQKFAIGFKRVSAVVLDLLPLLSPCYGNTQTMKHVVTNICIVSF